MEWNDGMTNSLPWIIPSPIFFKDMGYTFFTCLVAMWHTFFEHASFISDMPCGACGIPSLGMHVFYFLTCLLDMWHTFFGYASFHFFIAHTIYNMERVIMDQARNFYCMDE